MAWPELRAALRRRKRRKICIHKKGTTGIGPALDDPFIDGGEGVTQFGILRIGEIETALHQLVEQLFGQLMGGREYSRRANAALDFWPPTMANVGTAERKNVSR